MLSGPQSLGLLRLEVVVDLVRVDGPLGEQPTPALEAVLLRAPPRDAALAHRVHGHRRPIAQPAEGGQPAAKAAGEGAVLGLQREQRRERRHRAAANVAQRVELVGRGRLGPRLAVLPLGAELAIRGARGLQVEPPEPRVQDAMRAVQVVVRDARLRGVVAHVAALVVAALLELATKAQRLLGLGAATAGLEDGIGAHAVLDLFLLVGAARLGAATGGALRKEPHGARGAEQRVGHAGARHLVDVTLEAV